MKVGIWRGLALATVMLAGSTGATVAESNDSGFTVTNEHEVAAPASAVWAALGTPSRWWSSSHSWSGDAKNFVLDPVAGGCFCERWSKGSAQHATVLYAEPGKLLRMRGSFGPLQAEALTGTLSISLAEKDGRTTIRFDYVVGGHARFALKDIAPAVDQVIGEQANRLTALFAQGK